MMFILGCLYFMLPAYLANMAPVFAESFGVLEFLARPIDSGHTFRGQPIFGAHKTWRGFAVGVVAAIGTVWLQYFLGSSFYFQKISLINYSAVNLWMLGFLFGFGALFGDLVKSFFKRRFSVAPGRPWVPFDQIDFVIGALFFVGFVFSPSWQVILTVMLITPILHILANRIGYLLKVKDTKW